MAEIGKAAPDFSLSGSTGQEDTDVNLADFEGKKLVILFYPLDFSPVCSEQLKFGQYYYIQVALSQGVPSSC